MSPGAKCFVDSEKARRFSLPVSGTDLKSHLEPRVGWGEATLGGSHLEEHGQSECSLLWRWGAVWSCGAGELEKQVLSGGCPAPPPHARGSLAGCRSEGSHQTLSGAKCSICRKLRDVLTTGLQQLCWV